ncbi:Spy/CpxP family protein refolding chaperone [Massilia sp. S19_KUP03_FR1]|uniref:Spy/CpxP family protein refolding chaperone n=1 Tax=Massilia sp. S19_KUP03_FR1 TaxID=3025503 RepID=UPI002FCDB668
MNVHNDKQTGHAASPAPGSGRRWLIAAALALAVSAAGASFAGVGAGLLSHAGHAGHMAMDPAAMASHIDKMVEHLPAGASPDQKARVAEIAKAAMADLRPAHAQLRRAHAQGHTLLMAPVIDRAALEQLRATQMQQADVISRRLLAALEDVAEVLTPEQRVAFAEHLKHRMH